MKLGWCNLFVFFITNFVSAQDTLRQEVLSPIIISAYRNKPIDKTSLNISSLAIDSLQRYGHINLTDLLSRIPGVTMLSTGPAISKPVIRGLYGNRILVLISGLKFDNQQWQEEHGLGLSDFGLSSVELIKGPLGVLYGSEAIGGVINLREEERPAIQQSITDFNIRTNSNTLGGMIQGGYKKNTGPRWFRIRAGIENHADYSDGAGPRVLNSRSDGYYLKSTYGITSSRWTSTNNFMSSFNRFGFIFNDIYTFITPDTRWSRNLRVNPDHLVLLNMLSSENKLILKDESNLYINLGVQSNSRRENEGGGAISLNMHLLTIQNLIKWEKSLSDRHKLILSNLNSFEDNTNYGARKIVPDARMQESNASLYLESALTEHLILENGVGLGEKWIHTFFTPSVNGPEKEVHPFKNFSPYYNFFSGLSLSGLPHWNIKANVASGVRMANLAELSSNGLHEGVFTYEIGNPNLKNEKSISGNLNIEFNQARFQFSINPFYHFFYDYIYLAPTHEEWFGFPVYRYLQQHARQYGLESAMTIHATSTWTEGVSFFWMNSKTKDGNHTPYIPATKMSPSLQKIVRSSGHKKINMYSDADFYFAQDRVAPFEIKTPAYVLWNAGGEINWSGENQQFSIGLSCNNLLNTKYYDHLSRFKNFGLLNIGRNIMIDFRIKCIGPK